LLPKSVELGRAETALKAKVPVPS